jgi:hypothetical protein
MGQVRASGSREESGMGVMKRAPWRAARRSVVEVVEVEELVEVDVVEDLSEAEELTELVEMDETKDSVVLLMCECNLRFCGPMWLWFVAKPGVGVPYALELAVALENEKIERWSVGESVQQREELKKWQEASSTPKYETLAVRRFRS